MVNALLVAVALAALAGWLAADAGWSQQRLAHLNAPHPPPAPRRWYAAALRRAARWTRRGRAEAAARGAVVELCGALAAELRAGRPPDEALRLSVAATGEPSRPVLTQVAATATAGGDVADALRAAAREPGHTALAWLAACWQVGVGSGAGLADAVERLATALRAEERRRREIQTQLAAPRATARLLAALPLLGILFATGLGQQPVAFLFGTPYGLLCLVAGVGLNVLGLAWTARIVRKAETP